jgi:hypothetical protein
MPHPSFHRVIQVLDRKRFGRSPANPANLLDIPAQYLVVRQSGSTEWIRQSFLADPESVRLVARLQMLFPRDSRRRCDPISNHPEVLDSYESTVEEDVPDCFFDAVSSRLLR